MKTLKDVIYGKTGVIEIKWDQQGECRFSIKAKNGEVVASGEGYSQKAMCLKGIRALKNILKNPIVKDL